MIYLDNSATTNYKPKCVVDAVNDCLTKYPFNPNRSGSKQALELQQKLYDVRKKLSLLYNNDSENHVAFTSGCTQALNLAILGNAKRGHIVATCTEHNSVLRPIMQLKRKGFVEASIATPNERGVITVESIARLVNRNTFMLCVNHVSNVTGQYQDIEELGKFARKHNLIFLVDCAQSAGYLPLDMSRCNVDLVAIAGHKGLHGIQGAGALIFNNRSVPRPITFGGTGTESHLHYQPNTVPDCLESGTLPTPAIMAMSAGIDYWLNNWQSIKENIAKTQQIILDGLSKIEGVKLYSQANPSGVTAFNVKNSDSGDVADELSQKYDIAVRGGLQCAPLMHKWLGTVEQGVVRASVSCVTTKEECCAFVDAVREISSRI